MGDRLLWLCRRGMRELDVLTEEFYLNEYVKLGEQDQAAFRELLNAQDPDLLSWLLGRSDPPPQLSRIVDMVSHYKRNLRNAS